MKRSRFPSIDLARASCFGSFVRRYAVAYLSSAGAWNVISFSKWDESESLAAEYW